MDLGELQVAPFWIVVSASNGPSSRPYRHDRQAAAFQEAERMARLYGGRFHVLEVQGGVEKNDIRVVRPEGMPF